MAIEGENADSIQNRSSQVMSGQSQAALESVALYSKASSSSNSKRKVQGTSPTYGNTGSNNYSQAQLTHANLTYGMNNNVPPPGWGNIPVNLHQRLPLPVLTEHNMWIIDSGATNHMVSSLNMLTKNTVHEVSKPVYLPNGFTTQYNDQEKEVGAAFAANDFKETNMVYGIEDWVMCPSTTVSHENNVSHESHTLSSMDEVEQVPTDGMSEEGTILVLVYVDDMLITSSSLKLIEDTKKALQQAFKMKDLGELKYFLGIEFTRSAAGILMHQRKYALELIAEVGLTTAKPAGTPININVKLTSKLYDEHMKQAESDDPLIDQTAYQKIIGKSHLDAALTVIRYLKNQPGQGLLLASDSEGQVTAFCDADWASCLLTRKSVTGYMIKIGRSLISWKAKKQTTVSRSSAKAEYRSLASTVSELVWLLGLLKEV
uniref:Reverse transcriptase Ty1/copia-type domain-containing protein n=1 Tax=Solanum lycopersicum TaxID=4081 RepID=A0A3Q7IWH6_SOLLC